MAEKTQTEFTDQNPTRRPDDADETDALLNWDVELPAPQRPSGRVTASLRPRGRAVPIPVDADHDGGSEP